MEFHINVNKRLKGVLFCLFNALISANEFNNYATQIALIYTPLPHVSYH